MKRKAFVSWVGVFSLGSLTACFQRGMPAPVKIEKTECGGTVTPPVNEGPFYKNEKLDRADIREGKDGIPVTYQFKVEDQHCKPIEGAIVDIWQCDKDGVYSDFSRENTMGKTWLRGMQRTDVDGMCSFKSIFPGWYNGRITHLHGKVHYNGVTKQTTNFFFPKEIEQAVYKNPLYTKGQNPVTIAEDIELGGDTERFKTLTMAVTEDGKDGYTAKYTIAFV